MRIIWVLNKELDISTSVSSRFELTKRLVRQGHEVLIVGRYRRSREQVQSPSKVILLPTINIKGLRVLSYWLLLLFSLPLLVLRQKEKFILYLDREICVLAAVPVFGIRKLFHIPCRIITDFRSPLMSIDKKGLQGVIARSIFRFSVRLASAGGDGITTISPLFRDMILSTPYIRKTKVGIWSSGVDLSLFRSTAPSEKNKTTRRDIVIMYHGNTYRRALREVLEAIANLNKDIALNRRIFLNVLSSSNTKELADHAKKLGISDYVKFRKAVPYSQVSNILRDCDLGIVPLPDTIWFRVSVPLKLLEYMALEKHVVVSKVGFVNDPRLKRAELFPIISQNGNLQSREIELAIRKAVDHLDQTGKKSEINRAIVESEFSWELQAERALNFLDNIYAS